VVTHHHARLSALVDGEVDYESRDRMLVHLAHCDECRAAAEAERQVKALLSGMSEPAPTSRLDAILLAVPASEAVGAAGAEKATRPDGSAGRAPWRRRGQLRSQLRSRPPLAPLARRPPGQFGTRRPPSVPVRRRVVAGVAGMAAMAGLAAVAAIAAGGDTGRPVVVPPVRQYSVERADVVSDLRLPDPGAVTAVLDRERGQRTTGR
jgi:Putative zinc-finger